MIYLTSDLHGGENTAGLMQYLDAYRTGDLLLILGDVGLSFEDTEENRRFTERFLSIDRPIAFLDGNHENHPYLNAFPEEAFCGGTVNRLSPYIVRLRRGEIYDIDGRSFFVMGGCKSSAAWRERGLLYEGEEPSREEIAHGYKTLRRRGNRVDFVLTHKYDPTAASEG
ncbi:MAG: metallophosphoesterase, partial [Clostridia bacterium]|nr:metallophosphoesterase [Clostridia bacterium]